MPLRIMITGPHAIGKSSTAKKLVKVSRPELLYVPSIAGQIAKQMEYDLNKDPPIDKRLDYQEALLKAITFQYQICAATNAVYDRSPIDLMCYLILGAKEDSQDEEIEKRLTAYGEACRVAVEKYCDVLVLPEADLSVGYEDKDNRPTFSDEQIQYRLEYSALAKVLASTLRRTRVLIVPQEYQYEERVKYIVNTLNSWKRR